MTGEQKLKLERSICEEMLLLYYNDYLFHHGIISESERGRMVSKITERSAAKSVKETKTINMIKAD